MEVSEVHELRRYQITNKLIIKKIFMREDQNNEFYFDPLSIYIDINKNHIYIPTFRFITNEEIAQIPEYNDVLSNNNIYYITKKGIKKIYVNHLHIKNINRYVKRFHNPRFTSFLFNTGTVYWLFAIINGQFYQFEC